MWNKDSAGQGGGGSPGLKGGTALEYPPFRVCVCVCVCVCVRCVYVVMVNYSTMVPRWCSFFIDLLTIFW